MMSLYGVVSNTVTTCTKNGIIRCNCNNNNNNRIFLTTQQQQRNVLLLFKFERTITYTTTPSQYNSFKRRCNNNIIQPTTPLLCSQKIIDFQKQQSTLWMSTTTTTRNSNKLSNVIDNFSDNDLVEEEEENNNNKRNRIDVAIVGLPNAGKSQLLNVMTVSKIAAVSRKRHTTRESGILGARTIYPPIIISTNNKNETENSNSNNNNSNNNKTTSTTIRCTVPTQIIFVDTPGFLKVDQAKHEGLDRDLVISAKASMEHVDYTLLVVDAAKKLSEPVKETIIELIFQALSSKGRMEDSDDDDDDDFDVESDSDVNSDDSESDVEEEGDDDDITSSDSDSDRDEKLNAENDRDVTTKHETREKFGVVLNKVDLIYPKSDLIDIAMEIGALAEECILYNYKNSYNRMQRTKTGSSMDSDEEATRISDEESDIVKQYVENNMPMFFYVSAKKNNGVDDVLQYLTDMATPCNSWDVEPDQVSTLTPIEQIEEVIREKIYRCLHKEVPYQIEQENRLLRVIPTKTTTMGVDAPGSNERNNAVARPTVVIHQDLIVRSKSHQNLVNGTSKQTLERIRSTAERDLSYNVFKCPVQLTLHVKLSKRNTIVQKRLPSTQQQQEVKRRPQ